VAPLELEGSHLLGRRALPLIPRPPKEIWTLGAVTRHRQDAEPCLVRGPCLVADTYGADTQTASFAA
jgi:hypothetical protein